VKRSIGIVGAGIGGLHLALYLQKHGVDATLITDRPADEYRNSRLLNTVAHHHVSIARETYLGIDHWTDPKLFYYYHDHVFNFPQPLRFRGDFSNPSRAVDYRIYLPTLMNDFARRGGRIEIRKIEESDIPALVTRFDLLVVSTGKGALGNLFSCRPEHSPYTQPQRKLCVGLYKGVRHPNPMNVTLSVSPGHGEMIVIPTLSFDGIATALLMENIPGADLDELATLSYEKDRKRFLQVLLGKLEKHHPTTFDRIDIANFDLCQPQDLLQGGVVPTVRNTTVQFEGGKCAIALGDLHAVVDPIVGQGANMASYAAFVMGEEIVKADALDLRFCETVDLRRQDRILAASRWTNLMLAPPTEAMGALIGTMSQNKTLCDEFTENFNYPERQWDRLATPARIHAWLDRVSSPQAATAAA
jgi:hypothetical protein